MAAAAAATAARRADSAPRPQDQRRARCRERVQASDAELRTARTSSLTTSMSAWLYTPRMSPSASEEHLYDFKGGSLRSPPGPPPRAAGARKLASSPAAWRPHGTTTDPAARRDRHHRPSGQARAVRRCRCCPGARPLRTRHAALGPVLAPSTTRATAPSRPHASICLASASIRKPSAQLESAEFVRKRHVPHVQRNAWPPRTHRTSAPCKVDPRRKRFSTTQCQPDVRRLPLEVREPCSTAPQPAARQLMLRTLLTKFGAPRSLRGP